MSLLRKASVGLALAVSVAALSAPAYANDPILNFGTNASVMTFTSNGIGGGTLAASDIAVDVDFTPLGGGQGPAFFMFTSNMVNGSATAGPGGSISALFGGGNFSIYTGPGGSGTEILSGTFNSGLLFKVGGGAGFNADLLDNQLVYTGGSAINEFIAAHALPLGTPLVGNLGLTFTAVNPSISLLPGGGLSSFEAQVSGNLDAISAVPEPGEWAAMGILASGLTGLMVRARRRRA